MLVVVEGLVVCLVGWSVFHSFIKRRKVSPPCSEHLFALLGGSKVNSESLLIASIHSSVIIFTFSLLFFLRRTFLFPVECLHNFLFDVSLLYFEGHPIYSHRL